MFTSVKNDLYTMSSSGFIQQDIAGILSVSQSGISKITGKTKYGKRATFFKILSPPTDNKKNLNA